LINIPHIIIIYTESFKLIIMLIYKVN